MHTGSSPCTPWKNATGPKGPILSYRAGSCPPSPCTGTAAFAACSTMLIVSDGSEVRMLRSSAVVYCELSSPAHASLPVAVA